MFECDCRRTPITAAILAVMLLMLGCAPNTASPGDDVTAGSVPQSKTAPTGEPQPEGQLQPGGNSAIAKMMNKMNREDIDQTLAAMSPDERTKVVLRFVSFTMVFYFYVYGHYPTQEEGLDILLAPPPSPEGKKYDPFAREVLLLDGWGRKLQYTVTAGENGLPGFKLRSLGPDGTESGDDVFPDVEEVVAQVTGTIVAGGVPEAHRPPSAATQ
jgi:hypothetical protein